MEPKPTPPPWYYTTTEMKDISVFPEDAYGFIYRITSLQTGRWYVGKKNLYSIRTKKLGKRALDAREDKRASKKKTVVAESDWKTYFGSEPELLEDLREHGSEAFLREILCICTSKTSLTYEEVRHQILLGCLESDNSYNKNILGKFFRTIIK